MKASGHGVIRLCVMVALATSCIDGDPAQTPADAAMDGRADLGVDRDATPRPDTLSDLRWPDAPLPDGPPPPDLVAPLTNDMAAGCRSVSLPSLTLHPHYCVAGRAKLTTIHSKTISLVRAMALSSSQIWAVVNTTYSPQVARWDVDIGSGALTLPRVFSARNVPYMSLFGTFVALSPAGNPAVSYSDPYTGKGGVVWGAQSKYSAFPDHLTSVPNAFDLVFLGETSMLVTSDGVGAAASGPGVYHYEQGKTARRVIKGIGSSAGHLALGRSVLFVSGYDSASNTWKIYGFSLKEIQQAVTSGATLTAADGDLLHTGHVRDAVAWGGDLAISTSDSSFTFDAVQRLQVSVSGDSLSKGLAVRVVGGAKNGMVVTRLFVSDGKLAMLLTNGTTFEVAVVQQR